MSTPAFVVPDERSWLLWGRDLRASGLGPVTRPSAAEVLVVPARLPDALADAAGEAWTAMPSRRRVVAYDSPLRGGRAAEDLLEREGHGRHEDHGGHEGHGDHDGHGDHGGHEGHSHHDMMAVTGDPSADGLVMEDLDVTLGPLSPPLPGGLLVRLVLDGDVVCSAHVEACLADPGLAGDPATGAAWTAASASSRGAGHVAAVELERALSHAAWAVSLGEVIGWPELSERAWDLAASVFAARAGRIDPSEARAEADRLLSLVDGSRRLRLRLRGLATVDRDAVERLDLHGPIARAAGVARDARTDDASYRALGFLPVTRDGGDAEARAVVRVEEARAALDLAARAQGQGDLPEARGGAVEGARGPLAARPAPGGEPAVLETPGSAGATATAMEAVALLELSAAMAALASFDLSGWATAA